MGKAVANLVPATLEEAEARAYAREPACMVRDEKISFFDIPPLSWFNRPDSVRWWKQWLDYREDARRVDRPVRRRSRRRPASA